MRSALPVLFTVAFALAASAQQRDPITSLNGGQFTLPAKPLLGEKKGVVLVKVDHTNFDRFSRERLVEEQQEGHDFQSWDKQTWLVLEGAYRVTDELTIGILIPFRDVHDYRQPPPNAGLVDDDFIIPEDSETYRDIGDAQAWLHYVLVQKKWTVGAMFGIEFPTGQRSEHIYGDPIPSDSQPGSGSFDFHGGVSAGVYGESWDFCIALTGKLNFENDREFEIGESIRTSVGVAAEMFPDEWGTQLEWTTDLWWEWRGQDKVDGHYRRESDGAVWYLAPGLRFTTGPVIIQLAFPIQFVNDIDEDANEDYRAVLTGGIRF